MSEFMSESMCESMPPPASRGRQVECRATVVHASCGECKGQHRAFRAVLWALRAGASRRKVAACARQRKRATASLKSRRWKGTTLVASPLCHAASVNAPGRAVGERQRVWLQRHDRECSLAHGLCLTGRQLSSCSTHLYLYSCVRAWHGAMATTTTPIGTAHGQLV